MEDQLEAGPGPQLSQLKVGQPVLARRQGGGWVRAKVVSLDTGAKRAVVSLVDLGITLPLTPSNIRTGGHGQISQVLTSLCDSVSLITVCRSSPWLFHSSWARLCHPEATGASPL